MKKENKETVYSYSRIDCFSQCGMKYFIHYVEGYTSETSSIALEIGSEIHSIEERIGKAIKAKEKINYIGLKNELIVFMVKMEERYRQEFNEPDKSNRTYREKIKTYLKKDIYDLENFMKAHPTYELLGLEQYFEIEYKDYKFHGYIDRVFRDNATNKIIIEDIKTYPVKVDNSKLKVPLQFVVYCLAAKALYNIKPEDVSCYYVLPFVDGLRQLVGITDYIKLGCEEIDDLFKGIEKEEFAPNPSALCAWCDFSPTNYNADIKTMFLCPYHSKWTKSTKSKEVENEWQGYAKNKKLIEDYRAKYGIKK